MSAKKILFPILLVGTALAFVLRRSIKPASSKSDSSHGPYDAIEAYIKRQMTRLNIPGAALVIVEGDQIVYKHGLGRARPGGESPSPQTPFFIGSLTKSITALAVMQLVEAGKVELDTSVQHYLPWFRVADPQASAQMTVRHLLNQTSGLPALPGELALVDYDDHPDATEHQVRALSTLKLTRQVGTKCEYSNLNYNILGLIVEIASSESYVKYIQNHIFSPLGMCHSFASKAEAQQNGLAMGHRHWFSFPIPAPKLIIPRGSIPSGQLISCVEDMAHYLIAHLNGGRYGEAQILSAAGINELHRGVKEYIVMGIPSGKYGMGWFDIDIGEIKTYSHGGNVPDFSAFMALVPEQKKGVVLLFNADPYGLPPITEEIGLNVTALLSGQQPAPIKLDFIQWIIRLLPLIPILQIAGVIATLRQLQRCWVNPAVRLIRRHRWGKQILLPLCSNLTLAAILGYLQSTGLLHFLNLFMPDIALITKISGGLAGAWVFLRTGLVLRVYRLNEPLLENGKGIY